MVDFTEKYIIVCSPVRTGCEDLLSEKNRKYLKKSFYSRRHKGFNISNKDPKKAFLFNTESQARKKASSMIDCSVHKASEFFDIILKKELDI